MLGGIHGNSSRLPSALGRAVQLVSAYNQAKKKVYLEGIELDTVRTPSTASASFSSLRTYVMFSSINFLIVTKYVAQ